MSSPHRRLRVGRCALIAAMVLACAAGGAARGADPGGAGRERIEVERDGARSTIEGLILVEAADGGLLVERDDDRLELLEPGTIRGREAAPEPSAAETPREAGRRVLAELPAGFDLIVTRHYCICFDTSRPYAQWCGALFERLHEGFSSYWRQAGFEVAAAKRPLVVVIFASREPARPDEEQPPAQEDVGGGF